MFAFQYRSFATILVLLGAVYLCFPSHAEASCQALNAQGTLINEFYTSANSRTYKRLLREYNSNLKAYRNNTKRPPPRSVMPNGRVRSQMSLREWDSGSDLIRAQIWRAYCQRFGKPKISSKAWYGLLWLLVPAARNKITKLVNQRIGKRGRTKRGRSGRNSRLQNKLNRISHRSTCSRLVFYGDFISKRLKLSASTRGRVIRNRRTNLSSIRRAWRSAVGGPSRSGSDEQIVRRWIRFCPSVGYRFSNRARQGLLWLVNSSIRRREANTYKRSQKRRASVQLFRLRKGKVAVPRTSSNYYNARRMSRSKFNRITKPVQGVLWSYRLWRRSKRMVRRLRVKLKKKDPPGFKGYGYTQRIYDRTSTRRIIKVMLDRDLRSNERARNIICLSTGPKRAMSHRCRILFYRNGKPALRVRIDWYKGRIGAMYVRYFCGKPTFCLELSGHYKRYRIHTLSRKNVKKWIDYQTITEPAGYNYP